MQIDWTKMLTVSIVSVGCIFLGYTGKMDGATTAAILGAALGYVFGNSHGLMETKQMLAKEKVK